jgi:DNA repair protein RAD7
LLVSNYIRSRRANNNRIRGPQSALTDYLAQHNISAAQIRDTFQERLAAAQASANANPDEDPNAVVAELMQREEDQRNALEAAAKAKADKKKKKQKKRKYRDGDDDGSDDDFDALKETRKSVKLPGQITNCGECDVRFTVTPYSKANSEGDLLCPKCSKQQTSSEPTKKRAVNRDKRRMNQSQVLDGKKRRGAKSLLQLCIEVCTKV